MPVCRSCARDVADGAAFCGYCGASMAGPDPGLTGESAGMPRPAQDYWVCSRCSVENLAADAACQSCGFTRSAPDGRLPVAGVTPVAGTILYPASDGVTVPTATACAHGPAGAVTCPSCGRQTDADSRFCMWCGRLVPGPAALGAARPSPVGDGGVGHVAAAGPVSAASMAAPTSSGSRSSWRLVAVVAVLVALIAGGVAAFLVLRQGDGAGDPVVAIASPTPSERTAAASVKSKPAKTSPTVAETPTSPATHGASNSTSTPAGWGRATPVPLETYVNPAVADGSGIWVSGWNGTLLASYDGGATWDEQTIAGAGRLQDVAFSGADQGIAVGDEGQALVTGDGGSAWDSVPTGASDILYSVSFCGTSGSSEACAVGNKGAIVVTADGGWTRTEAVSSTNRDLSSVAFFDDEEGVAVGNKGTVLLTEDGGITWSLGDSATGSWLTAVSTSGSQRACAVGTDGAIVATRDAGQSWARRLSGVKVNLYGVALDGSGHGWAVGRRGTLLSTRDAGWTWTLEHQGGADLWGVAITDDGMGITVGSRGTILIEGLGK